MTPLNLQKGHLTPDFCTRNIFFKILKRLVDFFGIKINEINFDF